MTETSQETGQTRQQSAAADYRLPPVDIYENDSGITLMADMPGVTNDRLNLEVDKNSLLIEGEMALEANEEMQAVYAEIRNPRYRRSFALSSEFDMEAIQASLKDGVLTLHLPKKAMHQPRKITVQST